MLQRLNSSITSAVNHLVTTTMVDLTFQPTDADLWYHGDSWYPSNEDLDINPWYSRSDRNKEDESAFKRYWEMMKTEPVWSVRYRMHKVIPIVNQIQVIVGHAHLKVAYAQFEVSALIIQTCFRCRKSCDSFRQQAILGYLRKGFYHILGLRLHSAPISLWVHARRGARNQQKVLCHSKFKTIYNVNVKI